MRAWAPARHLKEDLEWAPAEADSDLELLLRRISPLRKKMTKRPRPMRKKIMKKPSPLRTMRPAQRREPVQAGEPDRVVSAADFSPAPVKAALRLALPVREPDRASALVSVLARLRRVASAVDFSLAPVKAAQLALVPVREPDRVSALARPLRAASAAWAASAE